MSGLFKSKENNKLTIKFPREMTYTECMRYVRPLLTPENEEMFMQMEIDPHHKGSFGKWFSFKDTPYKVKIHHVNVGLVFEIKKKREKKAHEE